MASASAEGLDLQGLSSNWKKLQEKLKVESTSLPKRKAAFPHEPQRNKKQSKSATQVHHPSKPHADKNTSKMGLSWSSSSQAQKAPSATLALWAEDNDITAQDLHAAYGSSLKATHFPDTQHPPPSHENDIVNQGLSPTALSSAGKYIAIDCEMVGVGPTPSTSSALARISLVNYHGHQLYDSFVIPKEPVTDYRTPISGITLSLLSPSSSRGGARTLSAVQADVSQLLKERILVGHAIKNDLAALMLGHPKRDIRDTSRHAAFRRLAGGRTPALKKLAREVLGVEIQGGEHSSVEDARATMLLFRREKEGFEREHVARWGVDRRVGELATAAGGGGGEERGGHKKSKSSKKKKKGKRMS